ncbi:hypothetical protein Tco_0976480 [Tanacetum coccineum]|uniref:Uncharacterized protein n=1 Tax=Tanacetum coccineum TaxID=301880 RepID=A0ABQ5EHC4_9ASTR
MAVQHYSLRALPSRVGTIVVNKPTSKVKATNYIPALRPPKSDVVMKHRRNKTDRGVAAAGRAGGVVGMGARRENTATTGRSGHVIGLHICSGNIITTSRGGDVLGLCGGVVSLGLVASSRGGGSVWV